MKQITDFNLKTLQKPLIYPIFEDQSINEELSNLLDCDLNLLVDKKENEITVINTLNKCSLKTITFIGLGNSENCSINTIKEAASKASLKQDSYLYVENINYDKKTFVSTWIKNYIISSYKEKKINQEKNKIYELDVLCTEDLENTVNNAQIIGNGVNYARYLSDLPTNYMTPDTYVEEALQLSKNYDVEVDIIEKDRLKELKAGGLLAVNQGSDIPCRLVVFKYSHGTGDYKAIVGKGVTFDSGGYSLKVDCYGMKYDMCGAANVLAIMKIIAGLKLNVNVYGVVPVTENLIGNHAYKPQDVITMMNGKTVEIVSTDAEGRMILGDALTYTQTLNVSHIIDMATLTGACFRALGEKYSGLFSNCDKFVEEFKQCADENDEKVWRLPIDKCFVDHLKSSCATLRNGEKGAGGGASIAASFLNEFVDEKVNWIHLDMAGTATKGWDGATGAMIQTIVTYLQK